DACTNADERHQENSGDVLEILSVFDRFQRPDRAASATVALSAARAHRGTGEESANFRSLSITRWPLPCICAREAQRCRVQPLQQGQVGGVGAQQRKIIHIDMDAFYASVATFFLNLLTKWRRRKSYAQRSFHDQALDPATFKQGRRQRGRFLRGIA